MAKTPPRNDSGAGETETQGMPIMVHLTEMRDRLIKSVVALVITTAVAFIFAESIIEFLKQPAGNVDLIAIELTENLGVFFRVSLAGGVIMAMPVLVYQLFAFVAPALTSREKRYVFTILPFVVFMFLAGVAFAYYVAMPPAMGFLLDFLKEQAETQIRISNYLDVVTRLILGVGFIFETPVIIMFMARMGLVTPQWLASKRRWWIVLAFVVAAIVTPTFDPINQSVIAIPLILLLELSILLSRFVYKPRNGQGQAKTKPA
ncbi:MAG: twin-arginine translocase subunit TatC [Dehalococcoidaceae bacterium]|nr:twin-arginine translocase subunit TatC [Dehalococcoidaceae bacterium]